MRIIISSCHPISTALFCTPLFASYGCQKSFSCPCARERISLCIPKTKKRKRQTGKKNGFGRVPRQQLGRPARIRLRQLGRFGKYPSQITVRIETVLFRRLSQAEKHGAALRALCRVRKQKVFPGDLNGAANRAYKTHYARYMKKKMTVAQFEQWSRQTVEWRNAAAAGKLPQEEYERTIKELKLCRLLHLTAVDHRCHIRWHDSG